MTNPAMTGHRGATATVLAVAGGALAVATWIGGAHVLALVLVAIYACAAVAAYAWSGRESDVAAVLRAGGDERQRRLDHDATALAGLAMGLTAIVGAIISAAREGGNLGGYGVICFVGGVTYAASLAVMRSRD